MNADLIPPPAAILDALGDGTRRAMLAQIAAGPVPVSAVARQLDITLTAVGQHLRVLERAQLATSRKTGRVRECAMDPQGLLQLESWARQARRDWESRLDRLASLMADIPPVQGS
jgi:DNA-binding transcriptional ArsR family regulator